MANSIIDTIGEERARKLMGDSIREDVAKRKELGLPEIVMVDDVPYFKYPDGRVEPAEKGLNLKPEESQKSENTPGLSNKDSFKGG